MTWMRIIMNRRTKPNLAHRRKSLRCQLTEAKPQQPRHYRQAQRVPGKCLQPEVSGGDDAPPMYFPTLMVRQIESRARPTPEEDT